MGAGSNCSSYRGVHLIGSLVTNSYNSKMLRTGEHQCPVLKRCLSYEGVRFTASCIVPEISLPTPKIIGNSKEEREGGQSNLIISNTKYEAKLEFLERLGGGGRGWVGVGFTPRRPSMRQYGYFLYWTA